MFHKIFTAQQSHALWDNPFSFFTTALTQKKKWDLFFPRQTWILLLFLFLILHSLFLWTQYSVQSGWFSHWRNKNKKKSQDPHVFTNNSSFHCFPSLVFPCHDSNHQQQQFPNPFTPMLRLIVQTTTLLSAAPTWHINSNVDLIIFLFIHSCFHNYNGLSSLHQLHFPSLFLFLAPPQQLHWNSWISVLCLIKKWGNKVYSDTLERCFYWIALSLCEHIHLSLKSINVIQIEVNHTLPLLFFFAVQHVGKTKPKKNHQKENTHRKPSHNHQKQIQWLEELQQHWHQWTHKITHSFVKIPPKKMCVLVLIDHSLSLVCFVGVVCEGNEKSSFFFWMILSFLLSFFWWSQTTSFKRSKS